MGLFDKIVSLYPELTNDDFDIRGTIALQNDGEGAYIAKWEHPTLPRPTDEQLAGVTA